MCCRQNRNSLPHLPSVPAVILEQCPANLLTMIFRFLDDNLPLVKDILGLQFGILLSVKDWIFAFLFGILVRVTNVGFLKGAIRKAKKILGLPLEILHSLKDWLLGFWIFGFLVGVLRRVAEFDFLYDALHMVNDILGSSYGILLALIDRLFGCLFGILRKVTRTLQAEEKALLLRSKRQWSDPTHAAQGHSEDHVLRSREKESRQVNPRQAELVEDEEEILRRREQEWRQAGPPQRARKPPAKPLTQAELVEEEEEILRRREQEWKQPGPPQWARRPPPEY
ncbi:uncharacterized protein [Penaeus vannamei]|uniref:uncharacterized protein isoform X2 n=1 Tax=Penaeus vannamei TaxID=6689 RepID=UPI00387F6356